MGDVDGPSAPAMPMHTIFVDDLDTLVARITDVRKATYRDPDGNEIGFGGAPP